MKTKYKYFIEKKNDYDHIYKSNGELLYIRIEGRWIRINTSFIIKNLREITKQEAFIKLL